jgi:DNA-binding IclR family transcriptional regulator
MPKQRRIARDGLDGLNAGLAVLETFGPRAELTLTDISSRLGLYKSRVFRILTTLKRRGFVEQPARGGPYRLGLRLFELGSRVARATSLHAAAVPVLGELSERSRGTVVLRVLDGEEQVTLECIHSPEVLRTSFPVGARLPATYGSTGKVLLGFLPDAAAAVLIEQAAARPGGGAHLTDVARFRRELAMVSALGYAVNLEESVEGVRGVAAPVLGSDGSALAAIGISFPAAQLPRRGIPTVARDLCTAAREISQRLGHLPPVSRLMLSRPRHRSSG